MSTIIASNLQASGGTGTAATLASINGGPISGARNRIINGDMRIDQRNAGAANASTGYGVDRWTQEWTSTGVTLSFQQVSEFPNGFNKSLKVTVSTGSASFTNSAAIRQNIEGFNVADLAWGTASAQSITVSFWVRSSLTGSFGGVVGNGNYDRVYPFAYTISAANTWEYKTVTIPGDTTGTWTTDNSIGIQLSFGLGAVSARKATANTWANTIARQPTGTVDLIATTGATWQVTGVQLEAGTVATPFERRSYGQELALCQRYYQDSLNQISSGGAAGASATTGELDAGITFKCNMRTAPTITLYDEAGTAGKVSRLFVGTSWGNGSTGSTFSISTFGFGLQSASGTNAHGVFARYTASAEL